MKLTTQQKIQEDKYEFPYHYIPVYEHGVFSQTRNRKGGYIYLSYINFVLSRLKEIPFQSLLDVGCGDGRFLFEAYKQFPHKTLIGIDMSEAAVKFANAFSNGPEYLQGNITDKNVLSEKFDIISLIETLEHIPPEDVTAFLEAIAYFLKVKGTFFITVPSTNIPVRGKHYQHFDLRHLQMVLTPYFDVVEYYYLNRTGWQNSVLRWFLSNNLFLLNHKKTLNCIYHYYQKHLVRGNKHNSQRIFIVCQKKSVHDVGTVGTENSQENER